MRTLLCLLLLCATAQGELLDVPPSLRVKNYDLGDEPWNIPEPPDPKGHPGSCVWASTQVLLNIHGLDLIADWNRANYHSGSTIVKLCGMLDRCGVPYALETGGSEEFLLWCGRNRLGAVIFFKPGHCCTLLDYTEEGATILDNNHPERYEFYPREDFLRRWRKPYMQGGGQGIALTLVRTPPTPWPIPKKSAK